MAKLFLPALIVKDIAVFCHRSFPSPGSVRQIAVSSDQCKSSPTTVELPLVSLWATVSVTYTAERHFHGHSI